MQVNFWDTGDEDIIPPVQDVVNSSRDIVVKFLDREMQDAREITSLHEASHTLMILILESSSPGIFEFDYVDTFEINVDNGRIRGGSTYFSYDIENCSRLHYMMILLAGAVGVQHIRREFNFWDGAANDVMITKSLVHNSDDIWLLMSTLDELFAMDVAKEIIEYIAEKLRSQKMLIDFEIREYVATHPKFQEMVGMISMAEWANVNVAGKAVDALKVVDALRAAG